MPSRSTKKIPEYVYFLGGEGNDVWVEGPYVHPKNPNVQKNRKFALIEVSMRVSKSDPIKDIFIWLKNKDYLSDDPEILYNEYLNSKNESASKEGDEA